jgi:predicted ArsR family transcriptional regulator
MVTSEINTASDRPKLGQSVHLVCFQYFCAIVDRLTGHAPIITASRARGNDAVEEAGLLNFTKDSGVILEKLNEVFGEKGTRLCLIQSVTSKPNGGYTIHLTECACSYGQKAEEPACSYTLGVIIGAVQAITGVRMQGVETACQSCGADTCVYEIAPILA